MKILIYQYIIALTAIQLAAACDLIKFKHKAGKADFYEKLDGHTCNGEPIYKMLGDKFFMYKLPGDSNYWCDSYTPSKVVLCHAECDEVRFEMNDLYTSGGIMPEEFNGHFNEWIRVFDESIRCNDVTEFEDVFVHDSPGNLEQMGQIQEKIEIFEDEKEAELETKQKAFNEKMLDSLMNRIQKIQNNPFNTPLPTTTTPSPFSKEDKYILSMVNLLPSFENDRMEKIHNKLMKNQLKTASRFISSNKKDTKITPKPTPTPTKEEQMKAIMDMGTKKANQLFPNTKTSINKAEIFKNRDNSCTRVELEIIGDDLKREGSLIYEILGGVNCLSYPVYHSEQMFLFRNVFGEWCQKEMSEFKQSIECFRKCKSILLGPGKIQSPIETTKVTVFDQTNPNKILAEFHNHRYICTAFATSTATTCQNGGKCVQTTPTQFKCQCPFYSTGNLCEQIIDKCHSSPCLNNGECLSKPYEEPKCKCPIGFEGNICQNEIKKCNGHNLCQNGGQCWTDSNNAEFHCTCPAEYTGQFCQLPAFNSCKNKSLGDNIPHPTDTKLFLVCLTDGHYRISQCPVGLVFNEFMRRCDYNNDLLDVAQNVCEQGNNPCLNQGTCVPSYAEDLTEKFVCECKSGFNGTRCETNINDCLNDQCGKNGKCVDLIDNHVCICNGGFYGPDCSLKNVEIPCTGPTANNTHFSYPFDASIIVECDINGRLSLKTCAASLVWNPSQASCVYPTKPTARKITLDTNCFDKHCQNNGECIVDKEENGQCLCQPGFTGESCELNVNDCESNPCMNGGECVDGVNSYYCICSNKFIDQDCSAVATKNPCSNVINEFNSKKDKTVRYPHAFSKERFIVCNLEGFAQVLACPEGLIWSQAEETCVLKNENINNIYKRICTPERQGFKLTYPYSDLKYAMCLVNEHRIEECPKKMPYFCERNSKCVMDLSRECSKFRY